MATGSFARTSLKITLIMLLRKKKSGAAQPPLISLFTPHRPCHPERREGSVSHTADDN